MIDAHFSQLHLMQDMCVFAKAMENSELYATSSFPFLISKLLCAWLPNCTNPRDAFHLYSVFLIAATF